MEKALTPVQGLGAALKGGSWPAILDAFLAASVDSDNTRQAYRRRIREALVSMRVRSLATLTGAQLADYRAHLIADGRGAATHAQALAALRSFLRWSGTFGAHGLRPEVIAAALRIPRMKIARPYQTVGEKEIRKLLKAAGSARNRAIIGILLGCGLRVAEVSALDVAELIEEQGGMLLYVRQGKGRRDRTVPVGRDVVGLIRVYLKETGRTIRTTGPLFLTHDNGAGSREKRHLSARSVGIMLAHVVRRAGIDGKRISPHSLRHSFAIRALRRGGNFMAVSKLLGHASIATTQRYCDHLEIGELRPVVGLLGRSFGGPFQRRQQSVSLRS
jgi:site-specific recombinase XerD